MENRRLLITIMLVFGFLLIPNFTFASNWISKGDDTFNLNAKLITSEADYNVIASPEKIAYKPIYTLSSLKIPLLVNFSGIDSKNKYDLQGKDLEKFLSNKMKFIIGDISRIKSITPYILVNSTYQYEVFNSSTNTSSFKTGWKYEWKQIAQLDKKEIYKNQIFAVYYDIKITWKAGSLLAVDVVPSFSIDKKNFDYGEFAWANVSYNYTFVINQSLNQTNEREFTRWSAISGFNRGMVRNDCADIFAVKDSDNSTYLNFSIEECSPTDIVTYTLSLGTSDKVRYYFGYSNDTIFKNKTMIAWNDTFRDEYNLTCSGSCSNNEYTAYNVNFTSGNGTAIIKAVPTANTETNIFRNVSINCIKDGTCGSLGCYAQSRLVAGSSGGQLCGVETYRDSRDLTIFYKGFIMSVGYNAGGKYMLRTVAPADTSQDGYSVGTFINTKVYNSSINNATGKYWAVGTNEPISYNMTTAGSGFANNMAVALHSGNANFPLCEFKDMFCYPTAYEPMIPPSPSTFTFSSIQTQSFTCTSNWTVSSIQNQCVNTTNYLINTTYYDTNQCNVSYPYYSIYNYQVLEYSLTEQTETCYNSSNTQIENIYNDTQTCGYSVVNYTYPVLGYNLTNQFNSCFNATNYKYNSVYNDTFQCGYSVVNFTYQELQYNYTQTINSCNGSSSQQTFYYNDTQSCGFYTSNFTLANCTHGCLGGICISNPAQNVPFYSQLLLLLGFGVLSLMISGFLVEAKRIEMKDVISIMIGVVVLSTVILLIIM